MSNPIQPTFQARTEYDFGNDSDKNTIKRNQQRRADARQNDHDAPQFRWPVHRRTFDELIEQASHTAPFFDRPLFDIGALYFHRNSLTRPSPISGERLRWDKLCSVAFLIVGAVAMVLVIGWAVFFYKPGR